MDVVSGDDDGQEPGFNTADVTNSAQLGVKITEAGVEVVFILEVRMCFERNAHVSGRKDVSVGEDGGDFLIRKLEDPQLSQDSWPIDISCPICKKIDNQKQLDGIISVSDAAPPGLGHGLFIR